MQDLLYLGNAERLVAFWRRAARRCRTPEGRDYAQAHLVEAMEVLDRARATVGRPLDLAAGAERTIAWAVVRQAIADLRSDRGETWAWLGATGAAPGSLAWWADRLGYHADRLRALIRAQLAERRRHYQAPRGGRGA